MKLTPARLDYAAAVALTVALAGTHEVAQTTDLAPPVALILVLFSVLPAAVRRRWPLPVLAVTTAAATVLLALSFGDPVPQLAVGFVIYLIPSRFPCREACWLLAGTLLTLAVGLVAYGLLKHTSPVPALAENVLLVAGAWVIGYIVVQQRLVWRARRDKAERDDRIRIARELHDVVAHSLSLIAVQAGVAGYVAKAQPDEAQRALASIEEISRGALREMRALLGVLRVDDDVALEPAHGLADLDSLAERVGGTGVAVTLEVRGTRRDVLPGVELAAYRVVQEAVTNVIKHSGAHTCRIVVAYEPDALTLSITDDGRPVPGPDTGGHGIKGMRERVAMYGGTLVAEPLPTGGFGVTARFPA